MKLLALAALSLTVLPACPLAVCGVPEENSGTMYVSGEDSLMVCNNGGFAYMAGDTFVEGHQTADASGVRGAIGETGAVYFTELHTTDGISYESPELAGTWTVKALDEIDLHHASVLCSDLETRTWWAASTALPKTATFQHELDTITLASDGTVVVKRRNAIAHGTYAATAGFVGVTLDAELFTAIYADETLIVTAANGERVTYTQAFDRSERAQ